jgi:hypothetical protein
VRLFPKYYLRRFQWWRLLIVEWWWWVGWRIQHLTPRQWNHKHSIYKLDPPCWCGMSHGYQDRRYEHHNRVARELVRRLNER